VHQTRAHGELVASLSVLLEAAQKPAASELAPLGHWLAALKPFWRVAGRGAAFDEMRRILTAAGVAYERCADDADLLVIDGPLSDAEESPAYWTPRLAQSAVVLVVGVQAGAGASVLWRNWVDGLPSPPVFRRASAHGGIALLLPCAEGAPPALRALCAGDREVIQLFEGAMAAAEAVARSTRQAYDAQARAMLAKADTLRLLQERAACASWNVPECKPATTESPMNPELQRQLQEERARADALQSQLHTLHSTNTYRAAMVMRRIGARLPPSLRIFLRRSAKLAWWTLRGRLGAAWRARRDFLRQQAGRPAAPEPGEQDVAGAAGSATAPAEAAAPQADAAQAIAAGEVAEPVGTDRSLLVAAVGYAVDDADLPRVLRAVERAQRALVMAGQAPDQGVLVADAGAPVALKGWLPAQVPVLPCRARAGFATAHGQLMELAFAQGADVYALADVAARFADDSLVRALRTLGAHAGIALVWAGDWLPEGLPDPLGPGALFIPRKFGERIGAIDELLDRHALLTDMCLRALAQGIPVVPLSGACLGTDAGLAQALSARRLPRASLDAAWRLAGRWGSRPLLDEISAVYAQRRAAPPPMEACEGGDMDRPLMAWWRRRMSSMPVPAGPLQPTLQMEAVPPPTELEQSLAVPFPFAKGLPIGGARPRLAAIVHLYYDDLAGSTCETLSRIPGECDLFITTDSEPKRAAILAAFRGWTLGALDVRVLPNSGSDVGPLLEVLREIAHRYELVLHLHGKKSVHWAHGEGWREHLYRTLCGSPEIVSSVLRIFDASALVGLVMPQHWDRVRPALSWGYSFDDAQDLAGRIGLDLRCDQPLDFPSGAMFWARTAALRPVLDFGLSPGDYVEGHGASTYAHALERLLLRACEHSGHTWLKIAQARDAEVTPSPIEVSSETELKTLIRRATFLLSDPALRASARGDWPWRVRPDDTPGRRWTLVCREAPSSELQRRLRAMCDVEEEHADPPRLALLPPPGAECPPPLDVRSGEVFLAADEFCAQIALQLCHVQKAFFGHAAIVRRLSEMGLAAGGAARPAAASGEVMSAAASETPP